MTIDAAYAKGKRTDTIPLHLVVVERLRAWLATRGELRPEQPLFSLRTQGGGLRRTSRMMALDLAAARATWLKEARDDQERSERERSGFLTYLDESGLVADFHANRHTFISNLGRAGVSLTTAQKLARHSDPKLTANVYTHLGVSDRAAAIGSLPAPPSTLAPDRQPDRQVLAATGTDNAQQIAEAPQAASENGGHIWGQLGGEVLQNVASGGESVSNTTDEVDTAQVLTLSRKRIAGGVWLPPAKVAAVGVEPTTRGL